MFAGSATLLASCAVSTPIEVHSITATAVDQPAQIAIALSEGGDEALKTRFAAALIGSFADRGISVAEDGILVADYALSISPAEIGVQNAEARDNPSTKQAEWIALPRSPRRFDKCEALSLRGTLFLLDRTTGTAAYRGRGHATDCEFDDAAIRELADRLVADFIVKQ